MRRGTRTRRAVSVGTSQRSGSVGSGFISLSFDCQIILAPFHLSSRGIENKICPTGKRSEEGLYPDSSSTLIFEIKLGLLLSWSLSLVQWVMSRPYCVALVSKFSSPTLQSLWPCEHIDGLYL